MRWFVLISSLLMIFVAAWRNHPPHVLPPFAVAGHISNPVQAPQYNSRFVSSQLEDFVHTSSITALPNGDLAAVWSDGSHEGAADVQIRMARFDARSGEWGTEHVLATRESTRDGTVRYINKLGNPVIALAPDNRLWMFYVSVSVGVWNASAINMMFSDDLGATWSTPRQSTTSPFFSISTLVRAAPVFHADGSIGLPVYHELMGKFTEYLYLSADGAVIDKFRISRGKNSLQPTVVPLDGQRAIAVLRYADESHHRVLASRTEDAGQTWSKPFSMALSTTSSSFAAVGTGDDGLLVALDDLRDGRLKLSLYRTNAQLSQWRTVAELDQSPDPVGQPFSPQAYREVVGEGFRRSSGCEFEYKYPYFSRSTDGMYHLVYSWNNTFIKHVSFNEAWLSERM